MPPSSSPKSTRSTTSRTLRWRSSQFVSLSSQPATGVSKVFAQPLQGSPLPSAIDGLPPVSASDDSRSIFSTDDRNKGVEHVEEIGVRTRSSEQAVRSGDEQQSNEVVHESQLVIHAEEATGMCQCVICPPDFLIFAY